MTIEELVGSLISSMLGGSLVAIANHWFTRRKTEAETEKLKAEADKVRAEAEKTRVETNRLLGEVGKLGTQVAETNSLISNTLAGHSPLDTLSNSLNHKALVAIQQHLSRQGNDRDNKNSLLRVLLPISKDNNELAEFLLDDLINRRFLIDLTNDRYELSRLAKQHLARGSNND